MSARTRAVSSLSPVRRAREVSRPGPGGNQLQSAAGEDPQWSESLRPPLQQDLRHPPGDHAGDRGGGGWRSALCSVINGAANSRRYSV